MTIRLMSHWCPDCDHWAFECRCELRADEARKELAYRREEIIGRGRAHPLRRTWVKFLRAQHVWFGGVS